MTTYLEAVPAYGRDYTSAKAVRADWVAGKDFEIVSLSNPSGRYINKDDKPANVRLEIRFNNERDAIIIS